MPPLSHPTLGADLTVTDMFCGAGGSSIGAHANGLNVRLAMNHWKRAIETHNTNFPNTDHACTDIQACEPRAFYATDILVASPECTNHSLAKGVRRKVSQIDAFDSVTAKPEEIRSRATMWDVPRFAEVHRYRAIIVENVVDARHWVMFDAWLMAMHALGYAHQCVYLNSMFAHPTPQSRDRMYVVFWQRGNHAPDLTIEPTAPCQRCGDVEAVQSWKPRRNWGRYKRQYLYCCPTCGSAVEPYYQSPADLGFPDEGYRLPPLTVRWHQVAADHANAGTERDGQGKLLRDSAMGVQDAAAVKRSTLPTRLAKVRELLDEYPEDHAVIWHDLEDERTGLEAMFHDDPQFATVFGAQDLEAREEIIGDFAEGKIARLGAKPVMLGSGVNFQRHCAWAIFAGIGFKFSDFIQAIHRVWRFGQPYEVVIDIIFADAEAEVRRVLEEKWHQHDAMMARMAEIIREYGLNVVHARDRLVRTIGVERQVATGDGWTAVRNDCVEETMAMATNSVGHIVTSIPFGTQYEYSASYNDFGHTDDDRHFWRQMEFLSPELLRVLQPGRILAVHVKDRVRPGGLDGWSFQTISPFHAHAILHYQAAGFAYMGMITISTDVVRENAQTYRLGWSECCKDGSKMSVGLPEYVLLFRKPPTDASNGYADVRVTKDKAEYSRARWQFDAHAMWRSNGNRLLMPEDLLGVKADTAFKMFRQHSDNTVYDHEHTVAIAEARDKAGQLPPSFMLLQPTSALDAIWTDVTRMRTLNAAQYAAGRESHLCPLQIDIVDRLITRFSNPGDVVLDPFGGLMTVPLRAVALGRQGYGIELAENYWRDGLWHLRRADEKRASPTLFDLVDAEVAGV